MAFSRPSAAYKLNDSCYYFYYCFRRYFSLYTTHICLAATACINPAVTYYSPPYYGPVTYWAYYYGPPYRGVARL